MGMPVPREAAQGLPSTHPPRQVLQLCRDPHSCPWGGTQTTDPKRSLSLVLEPVIFLAQRQEHSSPSHPELIIFKLHLLKARMSRRVGGNRESHCSNHLRFSDSFTAFISSQLCKSPLSSSTQLSYRCCSMCFKPVVAFWILRINGSESAGRSMTSLECSRKASPSHFWTGLLA